MKCEGARELFSEYLEGRIDYALTTTLRSHIEECQSCKSDFDLFKQTWGMLDTLPEIRPPVNFRHEIVMRAARMQHENSKTTEKRQSPWNWGAIFGRLVPARTLALTAAAAALTLVLLKGPALFHQISPDGNGGGGVTSGMSTSGTRGAGIADTPSAINLGPKSEWRARKVQRNTLWISVDPRQMADNRMLYRVLVSINQNALLEGETCARVWAKVWVLPPGEFGKPEGHATELWSGNILESAPLLVPVPVGGVNLLVNWRYRGRSFAQIVYIPCSGGSSGEVYDFPAGSSGYAGNGSIYSTLQSISDNYGVVIIANATVEKTSGVTFNEGTLDGTLRSNLQPAGLEWLAADHAIYVDRKLSVTE